MLTTRARRLVVLLAALTAVLTSIGIGVPVAAAAHAAGVQNRVRAFIPAAQPLIGSVRTGSPCSRQGSTVSSARIVVRFCVAAEGESPILNPADYAGKTPAQIDQLAQEQGLIPKGPDPMNGQGSYIDPVTGEQRVLSHPNEPGGGNVHVNDPTGQRLDINGNPVSKYSPAAHLPIGQP